MKKGLAILLAGLTVLSLTACSTPSETPDTTTEGTTQAQGETEQAATEAPAASTEGEAPAGDTITIGYVCNFMSHEWYQNVTAGAKRRAEELGVSIEIADANLDANQQVSFAENYIAMGVDVLALTPVDATTLGPIIKQAQDQGIIVVTESNPVGGETTCVGADNYESGYLAGKWMGEYGIEKSIDLNILVVGYPNFEDCRQRVEGFKKGLEESGATYTIAQEVDSQGGKERSLEVSTDALTANPDVNAIFGINDDSTQGAIQAYKSVGLDESKLVAVGYGLEGVVGREALLNNTPIKAELAMFPDFVGACIVDAAVKAVNGETLPERYSTPSTMVTPETYSDFYKQEGDQWVLDFAAVEALMVE